jgi:chromosome segregation ATPase
MPLRPGPSILVLAAALLGAVACEDPVPPLEAERTSILESSGPKAEFWEEVEQKGARLKEAREIEKELGPLRARSAALRAELEQLAQTLASARDVNARAEEILERNRGELARLQGEVTRREATLAGFESRRAAPAEAAP